MTRHYKCADCGMTVTGQTYHPHLYCLLRKVGVLDPDGYMAAAMSSLREHFPEVDQ